MLIEFGASNYYSFKESFSISFRLKNGIKEHTCGDSSISKMIGISGANASGKTNILKCLQFLFNFADSSFKEEPDSKINIESFFENDQPTHIHIEFEHKKNQYKYEISLTKKEVIKETIHRKKEKYVKIIERKANKITFHTKEFEDISSIKVRSNCSIISTSKFYDIESMKPLHEYFTRCISNISEAYGYVDTESVIGIDAISKLYTEDKQALDFAKKVLMESDTGIQDIRIVKYKNKDGKDSYFPMFKFKSGDEEHELSYYVQSSGTKALYHQLWMYGYAFRFGGVIIIDEIDIKLHPAILPNILKKYFLSNEKSNAQIIFTTHNSDILDFLGKYRVYLVNKESNESFCYRLDEIPGDIIRNDRSLTSVYKDGKIGGIPNL